MGGQRPKNKKWPMSQQQEVANAQKSQRGGSVARRCDQSNPDGCARLCDSVPIAEKQEQDPDRQCAAQQRNNDVDPALDRPSATVVTQRGASGPGRCATQSAAILCSMRWSLHEPDARILSWLVIPVERPRELPRAGSRIHGRDHHHEHPPHVRDGSAAGADRRRPVGQFLRSHCPRA